MSQPNRLPIAAHLGVLMILALSGCDGGGGGSPTAPSGPILVQAFQTATQPEPGGIRVQVRFRVMEGLDELSQAISTGAARGQVCLSGACVDGPITPGVSQGMCAGVQPIQVADTGLGFAAAWLDGDVVGVDFCVENVTDEKVFEITVMDAMSQSNIIRTTCTRDGSLLFCGSG